MSEPASSWRRSRRLAGWLATGAAAYAGVSYVLGHLGEERERRRQHEKASENMRMRFNDLQENCNFTVTLLLPNVAAQIFAALDVEGVTAALQHKSAAARVPTPALLAASDAASGLHDSFDKLTPSEIHVNGTAQITDTADGGDQPDVHVSADEPTTNGGAPHDSTEAISASQELSSSALGLSGALPPISASPPTEPERVLDPRTKLELWQEIKALAFTRTVTALYLVTILTLQTSVTLNLLGRADYLASVVDLARQRSIGGQVIVDDLAAAYAALPNVASEADAETDQKFLTFSWYLLHRGWPLLADRVRMAVDEIVGGQNLKAPITYDNLCELFDRIRQRIDNDSDDQAFDFLPVYFPPTEADEILTLIAGGIPSDRATVDPRLRILLDETRTFLSSHDGRQVQRACLDASFTRMTNSLEPAFRASPPTATAAPATSAAEAKQSSRLTVVGGRSARLANLLPNIARASHGILDGFPNEFVEELKDVAELKAFSAIVFSSFR